MTSVLYTLLGGALVVVGVLAASVADRVRGLRVAREPRYRQLAAAPAEPPRAGDAGGTAEVIQRARKPFGSGSAVEQDVVTALVASGYKKTTAAEAARGCTAADRATIESWTAAALRRAGKGELS